MYKIEKLENGLENIHGFYFGGVNAGFKPKNNDIAFIRSDEPCFVSAVFTTNKFQAAPIKHFKKYPKNFKTNFLLINSKNANAMTGDHGISDIEYIFSKISSINLINPIMASTGVIGYRLDKEKILQGIAKFDFNKKDNHAIATAIMTTDSFKKESAYKITLQNGDYFNIACICKGAGMINPAMATMLCFILTDAKIPKSDMDELLNKVVKKTFNTVSVDGDTSTNDSVFLFSSDQNGYDKSVFAKILEQICMEMAINLVKDGEGSKKVIKFQVTGAKNQNEAEIAAKALSNSLLVKTAIFGQDPNWGRIASTIGASGIECDEKRLKISYDNVVVFDKFELKFTKEVENLAYEIMKKDSYTIFCDIGIGNGEFAAYGCDLGYDYVKINADYRS